MGNEIVTGSVTFDNIRNKACIVCGAGFRVPRVGKLYCSSKCKQFCFYHRKEIQEFKDARLGVSNSVLDLSLSEFDSFNDLVSLFTEWTELKKRKFSTYRPIQPDERLKLEKLDNELPEYIKAIRPRKLTLETWSFFKVLYPYLDQKSLIKVVNNLEYKFFEHLDQCGFEKTEKRLNPVKVIFGEHLKNLAEGKIRFV